MPLTRSRRCFQVSIDGVASTLARAASGTRRGRAGIDVERGDRRSGVVSLLSNDLDFDGPARSRTERAGRVEPSLTPQSRSQIRVMPENSESACRGFDSRRRLSPPDQGSVHGYFFGDQASRNESNDRGPSSSAHRDQDGCCGGPAQRAPKRAVLRRAPPRPLSGCDHAERARGVPHAQIARRLAISVSGVKARVATWPRTAPEDADRLLPDRPGRRHAVVECVPKTGGASEDCCSLNEAPVRIRARRPNPKDLSLLRRTLAGTRVPVARQGEEALGADRLLRHPWNDRDPLARAARARSRSAPAHPLCAV